MLACGLSNGSIVALSVRRLLGSQLSGAQTSSEEHEIALTVEMDLEDPSESNGRAITGMKWVDTIGRTVGISHNRAPGLKTER